MRTLVDPDSKLFALLNKLVLAIELNIWVLLCCLPVVTAGAAFSSMHGVLLKLYRDEEKYVTTDFFQAMKGNLKNGTVLWLLFLGYLGLLAGLGVVAERLGPDGAVFLLFVLLFLLFHHLLNIFFVLIFLFHL